MSGTPSQIRLLLVEDVPQVAQYVRGLLATQGQVKLLDVLTDARDLNRQVEQLRPDIVIVDALLQGKVKGLGAAEALRQSGSMALIIVLTVPQNPVRPNPAKGIDHVLSMPFSGFELVHVLQRAMAEHEAAAPEASSRVYSVFAPKGGVGKTTLAFNLAVAFSKVVGVKTVLVDGSLQFGDLRALLRVPLDAPSILDLPTDRIQDSDLSDVLWKDPSGIEILLAPPRVEMAEMVTTRDVEKVLSLLRQVYRVIIIDTPASLSEVVLAFLDASDAILEVVTYDSTTIRNTRAVAETFRSIGYGPGKVRYVVNRSDSMGGMDVKTLEQTLGSPIDFTVVSDGRLVVESNNQGVPFVLTAPDAPISRDIARICAGLATPGVPSVAATRRR